MSVAALTEAVEDLDLPLDGAAIAGAYRAARRLDAKVALAVAGYEAAGLHEVDGALTIRSWLTRETGADPRSAAKVSVTGRKLRALPGLAEAVLDGVVSGGQLDVIVANVSAAHLALFAAQEAELVPLLAELDVEQTRRAMEDWRRKADALDDRADAPDRPNELSFAKTLDARGELRGSFDADATAVIEAALRVGDPKDFDLPLHERRAAALTQVCQHFLDHQQTHRGGRHRPHVNVVISDEELCAGLGGTYVDTGQPVSPAALGVLTCDSALHRLLHDGASGILDYGRATRTWPVDLYNAIVLRDGGCRFGNCDAPPSWCDVHHVKHWKDGGTTSIDDGVMGCRRHHHMSHLPGYSLKLLPDGTVEFTHPDGRVEISHPRGPVPRTLWKRRTAGGS